MTALPSIREESWIPTLRETDEAWEHTPEYEGFRPVPGVR